MANANHPSPLSRAAKRVSQALGFLKDNKVDLVMIAVLAASVCLFVGIAISRLPMFAEQYEEITAAVFSEALEDGRVTSVVYDVSTQTVSGEWASDSGAGLESYSAPYSIAGQEKLEELLADHPEVLYNVVNSRAGSLTTHQSFAAVLALMMIFCLYVRHKIRVETSSASFGARPRR